MSHFKTCSGCGSRVDVQTRFCPQCGSPEFIFADNTIVQQPYAPNQQAYTPNQQAYAPTQQGDYTSVSYPPQPDNGANAQPPKKKGLQWWHLLLMTVGVAVIVLLVVMIILSVRGDKQDSPVDAKDDKAVVAEAEEDKEEEDKKEEYKEDNSQKTEDADSDDDRVFSDIENIEGEAVADTPIGAEAELFQSGVYYLEGTIYSSGEAMPVTIATDGTNVQLTTAAGGISFGILVLEDATYVIQPNMKIYTELSDALIGALGLEDTFNVAGLQGIRNEDDEETAQFNQFAITINGEPGLCTKYSYADTYVKLYSIGDELIQIDCFDSDDTLTMQIDVETITNRIPSDQLTLKGLTKASVTSFLSAFAATS